MKKKFLLLNVSGDFLAIALRLQKEGYEVYSWYSSDVVKGGRGKAGKGMIELVDDWADVLNEHWEEKEQWVIMIDDNSQGDTCSMLRKAGWKVVGSSHHCDEIEHEREQGNDLAKKLGLSLPPTYHFTDFNATKLFLKKMQAKYGDLKFVFKGDGVDMAGSSKTYVAKSIADMTWYVDWIAKDCTAKGYKLDKFELQLVVEGLEVDFAAWYNGSKFAPAIAVTFEQKKIHNLGAAQGCCGQILTYIPADKSKFFKEHFSKLLPDLKAEESGQNEWAINNIVSERDHKAYFLEFTPRFGWDSTFGELALLQDAGRSIGDFFTKIAFGEPFPKGYFPIGRFSAAVRLFSEGIGAKGDVVNGKPINWEKSIEENLWFYSILCRDDGNYELTDNPFAVATAVADTPEEAIARVYAMIKPINPFLTVPDIFYSETIGENVAHNMKYLKEWGWL